MKPLLTNVAVLPVVDGTAVWRAQDLLQSLFGQHFDFWTKEEGEPIWTPVPSTHAETSSSAVPVPAALAANCCRQTEEANTPQVVSDENDEWALAIPLTPSAETQVMAVGRFETNSPQLLLRLAAAFEREWEGRLEVETLREENASFAEQVSQDFEELSFLRSMASRLEISQLAQSLAQIARTVLPLLNESLGAEAVAFVTACQEDAVDCVVGELLVRCGDSQVDNATIEGLIGNATVKSFGVPVVKNLVKGIPGVRSYIVAQVAKNNRLLGWLVAVNRELAGGAIDDNTWRLSSHEFGTHEASLLETTAASIATHTTVVELLREKEKLLINVVRAMVSAIDAKDPYTRGHSERVALYGRQLATQLGFNKEAGERLYLTGLLHDVGKIGVSDSVLKKPDRLTDEEFEHIKRHPDEGWAIMQDLEEFKYVLPGILYHHERWDGAGYPDGLAGEDIPLDGRILAVADAYDAMTSDRPYRNGMSHEKAEAILTDGAGSQWDPAVVAAFMSVRDTILRIRDTYEARETPERKPESKPQ